MRIQEYEYETVSNAGGMITVFAAVIFSAAVLFGGVKPITLSGVGMPASISIEYSTELNTTQAAMPQKTVQKQEYIEEETVNEKVTEETAAEEFSPQKESQQQYAGQIQEGFGEESVDLSANDEFLSYFLRLVQSSLHYPKNARKAGISGIVEIKIVFSASGEIKNASVAGNKHHKILSEAALKTVEKVKKDWHPILNPRREQAVIIPVSFELK
ncbi:MAG: TonB family protein [Endomicrobium sp.]|jgi:TonB family protein|nr:TonB family protein [Endomicrobium sp.]